ncbi:MAG: glutamate--tRNA ligase [Armatimonadetes bacterium]|nr:glutamate--tRNA ligase [Armatimonadota bacterium]
MNSNAPLPGPVRVRFAPSPTGYPHAGNLRTALYNWLFARHCGGRFILRIEDTDRERTLPDAEPYLKEALRWLGLDWDEGPEVGGPAGPYRQSERLDIYHRLADELIARGAAYRCYCPRERLEAVRAARRAANLHPYGYDRHCRAWSEAERQERAAAGAPFVVRFAIPLAGETGWEDAIRGYITYSNRELDDHVLLKSDGYPTYQFANVVDDHLMGITHVIRAEEWVPSTPRHLLEYQAFGWEPPVFAHLSLITEPGGKKLSKRLGARPILDYREEGYLPEALVNFLALLGWSPGGNREIMAPAELIELFSLEGIVPHPSTFDLEKLDWINGVYIRKLRPADLLERALPFLQRAGLVHTLPTESERELAARSLPLVQDRLRRLGEAPELAEFFFRDPPEYDPRAVQKWLDPIEARAILVRTRDAFRRLDQWNEATVEEAVRRVAAELEMRAADVIHPTRVAATGRTEGPGLFETLAVLGKERTLARIEDALRRFVPGG